MTLPLDIIGELNKPPCTLKEILDHFELDIDLPECLLEDKYLKEFMDEAVLEVNTPDLIILSCMHFNKHKSVLRIQPNDDKVLSEEFYDEYGKRMRGGTEYVRQGHLIAIVTLDWIINNFRIEFNKGE